jgi:hypothetical protein
MNYIPYIKQQALLYICFILSFAITYNIECYFELRKPIILTSGHISAFISGTLIFVFVSPLIQLWLTSNK